MNFNGATIDKIMGFMSQYSEKNGVDVNLYANMKTNTLQINTIDRTSFISVNFYITEDEANNMDYSLFEDSLNFLILQEQYRRKDVISKNVFQSQEQSSAV